MPITGELLIGQRTVAGTDGPIYAKNPATGESLEPAFYGGSLDSVGRACLLAAAAFDSFRATTRETRAVFLETIAENILALGDELIERTIAESGLTRPRLEGERGRTLGQLRLFAALVREGRWLNLTVDTALPERKPLARPDLRSRRIPLGPVAVFGASNFPLAFSVAGGDTAAALAAGCPVVAKSHPSHLGTSELIGRAIQAAVAACHLPEGTFSLLTGNGNAVGEALVKHPAIQAIAFTGSRRGGLALQHIAQTRPQPIPVFAEMSSTNPVYLLPQALETRGAAIAAGLVDSMVLGVGQFCTQPGIVLAIAGPALDAFTEAAVAALSNAAAGIMLNAGIHRAYSAGREAMLSRPEVKVLAEGRPAGPGCAAQAALFRTTANQLLANPELAEELFGPASLLVVCDDETQILAVTEALEGQLTATLQFEDEDLVFAQKLLSILERKAGRILVNGFPTGVEVSYAMVHGGPYPATSDSRVTSVGAMAIDRFLRPVCYQNFPAALLPPDLSEDAGLPRLVDGKLEGA